MFSVQGKYKKPIPTWVYLSMIISALLFRQHPHGSLKMYRCRLLYSTHRIHSLAAHRPFVEGISDSNDCTSMQWRA